MWLVEEISNPGEQKRTADSYLAAVRKADGFLDRNSERIPRELHAAGIRDVLIHFAAKETAGLVVELALPDEAVPRARSEFELVTTLLAELPPVEFPDADNDGMQLHLAAEREITSAWTGRGEKITYATAVRLAAEKQEAAIRPPDVDPESQELHLAAEAEIEGAWKSRGERITYLGGLRRAETKRSDR